MAENPNLGNFCGDARWWLSRKVVAKIACREIEPWLRRAVDAASDNRSREYVGWLRDEVRDIVASVNRGASFNGVEFDVRSAVRGMRWSLGDGGVRSMMNSAEEISDNIGWLLYGLNASIDDGVLGRAIEETEQREAALSGQGAQLVLSLDDSLSSSYLDSTGIKCVIEHVVEKVKMGVLQRGSGKFDVELESFLRNGIGAVFDNDKLLDGALDRASRRIDRHGVIPSKDSSLNGLFDQWLAVVSRTQAERNFAVLRHVPIGEWTGLDLMAERANGVGIAGVNAHSLRTAFLKFNDRKRRRGEAKFGVEMAYNHYDCSGNTVGQPVRLIYNR